VTEVLIVGASIAGAATAIHLSRLGHTVELIDRAQFPRRKPCGEGLFSAGVAELARLGVLPSLLPHVQVLTRLRLSFQGRSIEAPIGRPGCPVLGTQRSLLDSTLLDAAVESGADVRLGVRAISLIQGNGRFTGVETNKGVLNAGVIVAADGARSGLRRQAGLEREGRRKRYGLSAHFEVPQLPPPRVDVFLQAGYEVYVTPVGGSVVNCAVLMGGERARRLGGRLTEAYREMAEESGALAEGSVLMDEPLVAGPFPTEARQAWKDNLVLVGDAAGFYDGIAGDGMSLALVTARLCADAVDRFLRENRSDEFKAYARQRRALSRNPQLLAWVLLALAGHPAIGTRALENLSHHPATFAKLMRINQGECGFSSLRPRDLLAAFVGL
jgi:flavin-dependent dehydrogenase